MQILIIPFLALAVPKPPLLCTEIPQVDSFFCPGQDVHRYFVIREGCKEPVLLFNACAEPPAEDPDTIAPPPNVEPGYDEHDPTGPGEGPPGAETVDKPE